MFFAEIEIESFSQTFLCISSCFCVHHFRFLVFWQSNRERKRQKQRIEQKEKWKIKNTALLHSLARRKINLSRTLENCTLIYDFESFYLLFLIFMFMLLLCRRVAFSSLHLEKLLFLQAVQEIAALLLKSMISWNAVEFYEFI